MKCQVKLILRPTILHLMGLETKDDMHLVQIFFHQIMNRLLFSVMDVL